MIKSNSLSQNRRLAAQGAEFTPFIPFNGNPICDLCDYREPHPPHDEKDTSFHPPMENFVDCEKCGAILGNIDAEDLLGQHKPDCPENDAG